MRVFALVLLFIIGAERLLSGKTTMPASAAPVATAPQSMAGMGG